MTFPDARRDANRLPARLRRYFGGRSVAMLSPLAPAEVERRINRAAASTLWRAYRPGVAGWARCGLVRLRVHGSLIYSYRPVLAGRISREAAGSRLRLNYRAPVMASVFYLLWYLFLALLLFALSIGGWAPGVTATVRAQVMIFLGLALVAPLFLLHWSTAGADEDLEQLVAFLEREAQAKPVRSLVG
jgi:hypothetical protein